MTTTTKTTIVRADRLLPKQPFGTKFLDALLLLSPRYWHGFCRFVLNNPINNNHPLSLARRLFDAWVGLLLPTVSLLCVVAVRHHRRRSFGLLALFLCSTSPWNIRCIGNISIPAKQVAAGLAAAVRFRASTPVLPEAVGAMSNRIENGRAFRERRYDVYLPAPRIITREEEQKQQEENMILILPGAYVSHAAYAEVAGRLSDHGFTVVVASMEPIRLASGGGLGADPRTIRRLMDRVERTLLSTTPSRRRSSSSFRWNVLGHSLGSFAAMELCAKLPNISKCVMWGTMYVEEYATDLSDCDTPVLLVQGSLDPLVYMYRKGRERFFRNFPSSSSSSRRSSIRVLPPLLTAGGRILPRSRRIPQRRQLFHEVAIRGGTHGGFATYNSEIDRNIAGSISREKQQELACQATAGFLKDDNHK